MTEEIKAGQIIEYDKDNTPHFIIDGVDVSECGFLDIHRPTKLLLCEECNSDFEAMECKDYTNCYYKQLKRLEQENTKLKEAFKKAKEVIAYCYDEEKPFISCIDCKYYEECKIQPVDYALRIIDEVLKDE